MDRGVPCAIVVMGVSGSGKSTLGAALAVRLGCSFLEGDDFHSAASIAKMRDGHPLGDADRWPWLDRLGGAAAEAVARDGRAVVACSALKRSYRARLAAAVPARFVLLDIASAELTRRLTARTNHYMPALLLDSQLATLERPGDEEDALVLDATRPPDTLVGCVVEWIG